MALLALSELLTGGLSDVTRPGDVELLLTATVAAAETVGAIDPVLNVEPAVRVLAAAVGVAPEFTAAAVLADTGGARYTRSVMPLVSGKYGNE